MFADEPWWRMLPALNAGLNATATVLLVAGFSFIKRGQITWHRRSMAAAFIVSSVFLVSYLVYHAYAGRVSYPGEGRIRTVYFTVLMTHSVLAVLNLPLVLVTIWRGWKGRLEAHRQIAKWTLPIWLYVSITGVVVYGMLYQGWGSK